MLEEFHHLGPGLTEVNSQPHSLPFLLLPDLPISSSTYTFPMTRPTQHFERPLLLGTRRTQHPQGPGIMGQSDNDCDLPAVAEDAFSSLLCKEGVLSVHCTLRIF